LIEELPLRDFFLPLVTVNNNWTGI